MQKQIKELDYSGQTIYVGLDVHKTQFTVSILGEELNHKTFTQPPKAEVLVKYLKRNFPGARYLAAYEAGFSGFWLQQTLHQYDVDCIVVNASDVPTKDKERKQKRDLMDSRKLARSLRNQELEGIYIPSTHCQQDRSLLRTRQRIVQNQTRCRNRIKALLYFFGINFPEQFTYASKHWSKRFIEWLKKIDLGSSGNVSLGILIQEAEFLRELLNKVTHEIRVLSNQDKYAKRVNLLMRVPGIGRLTAMTLLTELEDIQRFKSLDKLCAYVGLIPNVSASGDKEYIGDLTKRGNKILRTLLVECSWVAARKDPALMLKYNQLCSRMNGNKAIIRVARKLLNRIRFILINEQEYQMALVT